MKHAEKDLETLSGMIREGIKSDLTLYTKMYIERIDDKDIIIVKISETSNKPYYLADEGLKSSGVYLRHGNVNVQASEEVIKRMLMESNSNSFESNISSIQNLHFEYLKGVFINHNIDIDDNEVDFVAVNEKGEEYYQVSYTVKDNNTLDRELKPLDNINDHNPKYLLTTDFTPYVSHNGIKQINVFDWLLDK